MIAVKSPYQDGKRHSWGERIYAGSLADALTDLGVPARVDDHDEWVQYADADEAAVLIRGKVPYPHTAKRGVVCWMISELLTAGATPETDRYSACFYASQTFFDQAPRRNSDSVLFQATDKRIFYPAERVQDGPTLFVGNNYRRWEVRPVIAKALAEDLPLDVYGDRWDRKLGPDRLCAAGVDNAALGDLYRSAGVVLNDHRDFMRDSGLVSNRVFDVLACATPLISDRISGLPAGFEEFIYIDDDETVLGDLIRTAKSEDQAMRKRRTEFAQHVVEAYSFHAAAAKIAASLGITSKG